MAGDTPGPDPAREQPRTARVQGMFQPDDKARVIAAARASGLSNSSWLERAALVALEVPKDCLPPKSRPVIITDWREDHLSSQGYGLCSWTGQCWLVVWARGHAAERWAEDDWPADYRWREIAGGKR